MLRLDDGSGNQAFMGMGFTERSDSFDFNVALKVRARACVFECV